MLATLCDAKRAGKTESKMNSFQILVFQHSFLQLMPDADKLSDLFFARLFQLDPTLRGMFPNDLRVQKSKLMRALALVTRSLESPEQWQPLVLQLGRRHAGYGVTARHYEIFGQALLWTVETGLGEDFTPELRAAWCAFYDELATRMQDTQDMITLENIRAAQTLRVFQPLREL